MFRLNLAVLLISSISVADSANCMRNDCPSISVCSDDSTTGDIVYLSGVRRNDETAQCSCSLFTRTSTNIKITDHHIPLGCEYKFQFLYMTGSWNYSCIKTSMPSINTDGGIEVNLLSDTEKSFGFEVCLEIKSDSPLTLSCGKSRWSTTTSSKPTDVQTSDTESITTSGDESNQLTSGNNESNQPTSNQPTTPNSDQPTSASESDKPSTPTLKNDNSTTSGDEPNQTTSTQPTFGNESTTQPTTPPPSSESNQPPFPSEPNQPTSDRESNQPTTITFGSESEQQTTPTSKNDNSLSAIIGGSVGGLVVIIVIIILVICVLRKRRKDKTYESPEAALTDAHPYQNIPDNRSGEITHPYQNIPDNRHGEITHQSKHNNEVVHQENDPYTNINNDIIKPSNGIQGMEYLENDLYISSDDVTDDVEVDDKPKLRVVAEYAQVNKSNANKTTNGNCKTGPKGDNYAVVNKGGKMINNDKQFKIGPSGDQYTVVKKEGKKNNNEAGEEFNG